MNIENEPKVMAYTKLRIYEKIEFHHITAFGNILASNAIKETKKSNATIQMYVKQHFTNYIPFGNMILNFWKKKKVNFRGEVSDSLMNVCQSLVMRIGSLPTQDTMFMCNNCNKVFGKVSFHNDRVINGASLYEIITDEFYKHIIKDVRLDDSYGTCGNMSPNYKEVLLKSLMKDESYLDKIVRTKKKMTKKCKHDLFFIEVKKFYLPGVMKLIILCNFITRV